MANAKILEQKSLVVDEIKGKFENAKSVVVFDPRGLNVAEVTELRKALRESGSDYKVYKNTLAKRAADSLDIKLDEYSEVIPDENTEFHNLGYPIYEEWWNY